MRRWIWRIGLAIGILEICGAVLWCLAGAGMYGSPLAGMEAGEMAKVWALLLVGPFSVLPAAILARSRPRWAALWLVAGGIVAGYLILFSIPHPDLRGDLTFETTVPLLLVSLPMLVLGALHMLNAAPRGAGESRADHIAHGG